MLPLFVLTSILVAQAATPSAPKGVRLASLTWPEAQAVLHSDAVVVIPLGAAALEHGPHLKLGNDLALAEYLTRRIAETSSVVIAPALPYHHYPAFIDYPGSTSLSLAAARDLTADIVRSLARVGPRRFYVLNTGTSTAQALEAAAAALAAEGILLRYTDWSPRLAEAARNVRRQEGGSHADEIETSMMLHIEPGTVDMRKAARDLSPESRPFRLTRAPAGAGTYSPTGIWGDATLATRDKGRIIVDALVSFIHSDIEALRAATPPPAAAAPAVAAKSEPPRPAPTPDGAPASSCTAGDERAIRRIAEFFYVAWNNQNYETLGALWTADGDIVHPDAFVERGRQVITQNRRELFTRREYRGSRHPLTFGNVRCVTPDVAVVDGKWELRGVTDADGKPVPPMEGLLTLVVRRAAGWRIEAYRYTLKPPTAATPPIFLKRPGYPSGQ